MFKCTACKGEFSQQSSLNRHQRKNKFCSVLKQKIDELKNQYSLSIKEYMDENIKLKDKCSRLKSALRGVAEERDQYKRKYEEHEKNIQNLVKDKLQLEIEVAKIIDDNRSINHKLQIAETKVVEKEAAVNMVYDIAKNSKGNTNKTVINNNTLVIQDFRVKPAEELRGHKDTITDFIREHSVVEACQYFLKEFYWSIPPNIDLKDQARKKIFVLRNNKWEQENMQQLVHKLYHKSFQKIAFECIQDRIDYHEDWLSNPLNMRKTEQRRFHDDELMVWGGIKETWDQFRAEDLHQPFMVTINNLRNKS